MYQNIYIERGEQWGQDTIHLWDDKEGYRVLPFRDFSYGYKPDKNGRYVSMTGVRLGKVNRFKKDDPDVFEGDLAQETRVLTDLYLQDDIPSVGHKVMFFDIEVSMKEGLPNTDDPMNEITSIAFHDSTTDEYYVFVLDRKGLYQDRVDGNVTIRFFRDEESLLMAFLDEFETISPTIVSGWNSDQFDIPYLYGRIRNLFGPNTANRLSSIGKVRYSNFRRRWLIAGTSCLDYLDLYKKFTYSQLPNHRLDTVAKAELGRGKIHYTGSLDDLFRNDIEEFIRYNLEDVRLLVDMDRKLKLIELVRGICHIGHVPYEDYCYSSKFLEGTVVTYLHRKGIIVTNKPAGGRELMDARMEDDDEQFTGAYVKTPMPAMYDWVYSLDLQSLYPSIIMSLNISPETKIGFVTNWDAEKHRRGEMEDYKIRGTTDEDTVSLNRETFDKYMKNEKLLISSNGVLYSTVKTGIIPEILNRWFEERVEYKNLMKKYKTEGNEELAEFYDRRQHIQKIFLNSMYGVLGLPIFRFFDVDNALAVTASGQDVIKNSAKFVNELYASKNAPAKDHTWMTKYWNVLKKEAKKKKEPVPPFPDDHDHCVYIDTDSLYFCSTPIMPEGSDPKKFTIKLAYVMEKMLNQYYDSLASELFYCDTHRLHIKGESVAERGIWIAKKRYALRVVYDLESKIDVDNKLKIKGLDAIRSTFPPAFRDLMKEMMVDLLTGQPQSVVDAKILTFRKNMPEMDYLDVARNTGISGISEYDNGSHFLNDFEKGTPAHVKAALTYNALLHYFGLETKFEPIADGAKVKWVYLKDNPLNVDALAIKGFNDPTEVVAFLKEHIDHKALYDKELKKKLQDFYDAVNWGNIPTDVNQNAFKFFTN